MPLPGPKRGSLKSGDPGYAAWYSEHRDRILGWQKQSRAKAAKTVNEWKSKHGCSACGERDTRCLDAHHVNPDEKSFSIGSWLGRASLEAITAELEKCIVLCANCHRKHHSVDQAPVGAASSVRPNGLGDNSDLRSQNPNRKFLLP